MTQPSTDASPERSTSYRWVYALGAFAVGAAIMALEIVASRFLAPVFDGSVLTWAALISVVMVALTAGYFAGGRLADRRPYPQPAGLLVVGAAFYLLLAGRYAAPLLLPLGELIGDVRGGALAGALLLTGVPVALLATYSPYAVRLCVPAVARTGTTAGVLYGISTFGSVVGCLFTAFVLVPRVGSAQIVYLISTFSLLTGAALLAAGLLGGGRRRAAVAWSALLLIVHTGIQLGFGGPLDVVPRRVDGEPAQETPIAAGSGGSAVTATTPFGVSPTVPDGTIEERESPYSSISVVKEGDVLSLRFARVDRFFNESRVNLRDPGELPMFYTRLLLTGLTYPPTVGRLLMIGVGGGSTTRYLREYMPDLAITAVELDSDVIDLARRYFGLPGGPGFTVVNDDGRLFLHRTADTFDVIVIDVYRCEWIPFHLTTQEFFSLARSRLDLGGCVVVNLSLWSPSIDNTLNTLRSVFDQVDTYYHTERGNLIAVAYDGAALAAEQLQRRATDLQLRHQFTYHLRGLLEFRRDYDRDPEAEVLRDDFAPAAYRTAIAGHNDRPSRIGRRSAAIDSFAVEVEVVRRIEVDGDLSDWPVDLPEYPIRTSVLAYGVSDVDGTDLSTSADLSPSFRVAYNPAENLLYLAVRVRDNALVTGGADPWSTDACEVFVSAASDAEAFTGDMETATAADLPVLQYVAIPGPGTYGEGVGNPSLSRGRIDRTRTRMAHARQGDVTVYEWCIEVYDRYADQPAQLTPGRVLGFDLVVVDKDGETDTPAWICWGPARSRKYANPGSLGRLILVGSE